MPALFVSLLVVAAALTVPGIRPGGARFDHRYPRDPRGAGSVAIGAPIAPVPATDVVVAATVSSLAALAQALPPRALVDDRGTWVLRSPVAVAAGAVLAVSGPARLLLDRGSYLEIGPGGTARLEDMSIASTGDRRRRGFLLDAGGRMVLVHDRLAGLGRLRNLAYGVAFAGVGPGSAVVGSTIEGGVDGVYVTSSAGLRLVDDRISGSLRDGVELRGGVSRALLTGDVVAASGLDGVALGSGVTGAQLLRTRITGAADNGVLLYEGATRNLVEQVRVSGCLDGLVVSRSGGNAFTADVVTGARRFALRLADGAVATRVRATTLSGAAVGAYVAAGAHGDVLLGNRFSGNRENVRIRGSATSVVVRPRPAASEWGAR